MTLTRCFAAVTLLCACAWSAHANDQDDATYDQAVRYLLSQQRDDGGFGDPRGSELGITAIAVKALAKVPAHLHEEVEPKLARAVEFILAARQEDGSFVQGNMGIPTYRTAVAISALAAVDREAHKEAIAQGAAYLTGNQIDEDEDVAPGDPRYGGFTYGKAGQSRGGRGADLSNTHMAVSALKDAGIAEDDPVFQRVLTFVHRCQNDSEVNDGVGFAPKDDGGFVYNPVSKGEAVDSYAGMTYSGLLSLVHAGASLDSPSVKSALRWIAAHYTLERNEGLGSRPREGTDQSGLYYYYYVFAKCLAALGKPTVATEGGEQRWARDLFNALAARQQDDGSFVNSDPRWWESNPVLATAYAVHAMNDARPFLAQGQ